MVVDEAVTDELIVLVVEAVRPVRPNGHGAAWQTLCTHEEQIRAWVSDGEHDGVKHDPVVETPAQTASWSSSTPPAVRLARVAAGW